MAGFPFSCGEKMKNSLVLCALSAVVSCSVAATTASADVTTFTTRTAFATAAGNLTTEGFENATTDQTQFATPLDSTTTNPNVFFGFAGKAFVPGEIVPGIHINSVGTGQAFVGNNIFSGDSTEAISAGKVTDNFDLTFDSATAVGLDFGSNVAGTYTITAYDGSTVISSLANVGLTLGTVGFAGFVSTTPITRVNLTNTSPSPGFTSFDNVSFGVPAATPEPASLGMLAMGGTILLGRRRKA
jgi:hypothetical protein